MLSSPVAKPSSGIAAAIPKEVLSISLNHIFPIDAARIRTTPYFLADLLPPTLNARAGVMLSVPAQEQVSASALELRLTTAGLSTAFVRLFLAVFASGKAERLLFEDGGQVLPEVPHFYWASVDRG